MFKNLRQIKSYLFPMEIDVEGIVEGGGGGGEGDLATGVDSDVETGKPVATDDNSTGDQAAAEDKDSDADTSFQLEIDGENFSEQNIRDWKAAHTNKSDWEGKLHSRGEELNILQAAIDRQAGGTGTTPAPAGPAPSQAPTMTGEELQTIILERPGELMGIIGNLIESAVVERVGNAVGESTAQQNFNQQYPDYHEVTASQDFKNFAARNPHYSPVNNYLAFQLNAQKDKYTNAEKEGFNKGEETTIKNLKAKGGIRVLSGGGSSAPTEKVPDVAKMTEADKLNAATNWLINKQANEGG